MARAACFRPPCSGGGNGKSKPPRPSSPWMWEAHPALGSRRRGLPAPAYTGMSVRPARLQNPVGVGGADLHRSVAIARGDGDYIQLWAGQRQKHRGSVVDAGIAVDDDSVAHWSHPPDRFAKPWPFMAGRWAWRCAGPKPGPRTWYHSAPGGLGNTIRPTQARRHGPGDMGGATPPTPQTRLSVARYGAKWRLSYWFTARGTAAGAGTK